MDHNSHKDRAEGLLSLWTSRTLAKDFPTKAIEQPAPSMSRNTNRGEKKKRKRRNLLCATTVVVEAYVETVS